MSEQEGSSSRDVAEQETGEGGAKKETTKNRKRGHPWILTMDPGAKMEGVTTTMSTYTPPNVPAVRLDASRSKFLEKQLIKQMISDKANRDLRTSTSGTDYCSITQSDFGVKGFVPLTPKTTKVHNYKTDQAISFWSENYERIQGVTAVQTRQSPFKKSANFSTPISEQVDENEPPVDQ